MTAETSPARARRADGRPPGAAAGGEDARPARRASCSRSTTSSLTDDKGVAPAEARQLRRAAPARSSASPASPATASRSCSRCSRGIRAGDRRHGQARRQAARPRPHHQRRRPPRGRRSPTCPRTGTAAAWSCPSPQWENSCLGYQDEPRFDGPAFTLDRTAIRDLAREGIERFDIRPPSCDLQDRQLLRRQPAEDRHRPRDRARPRACCSSASRPAASTSAPSSSSTSRSSRCATGQGDPARLGRARRDPGAVATASS